MKLLLSISIIFIFFINNSSAQKEYNQGLYYKRHAPKSRDENIKGVVILTHGILEHSGRYLPFIKYLNQQRYIVYRYDLRGHGDSDGVRAHIKHFDTYVSDLNLMVEMVEENERDLPLYLFGHSMGGLITFLYIEKYLAHTKINGIILSSPGLNIPLKTEDEIKLFGAKVFRIILPRQLAGEEIDREKLTDDQAMIKQHQDDESIEDDFTISLGVELVNASYEAQELILLNSSRTPNFTADIVNASYDVQEEIFLNKFYPPIFFAQGEDDIIVDAKANLVSAKLITSEKNIMMVPNTRHELLNAKKSVRNEVMKRMVDFLDENP